MYIFALEAYWMQQCTWFLTNQCKNTFRIIDYEDIYCYYYPHYHGNEQNSLLNDLRILIIINRVTLSVLTLQHLIHICIIHMFSGGYKKKKRRVRCLLIIPRYAINIVINAKPAETLRGCHPCSLNFTVEKFLDAAEIMH